MASIPVVPATPTPVFVTETRKVRADDRSVSVERSIDISPESRPVPDNPAPLAIDMAMPDPDTPLEETLSDVRPVIERLDGTQDTGEVLGNEEPDEDSRALEASEAYQALRKPDEALTPVGTI
ncbi:MAG: hypothetical protein WBG08_09320 [Litorimonas sp.]